MLTRLLLLLSLISLSVSKIEGNRDKRQALNNRYRQWTNGHVLFEYGDITDQMKFQARKAMQLIAAKTCLTFEETSTKIPRIVFLETGNGCWSYVGMRNSTQTVSLAGSCPLMGGAFHEISHALGFIHTMSRYDRDDYMYVNSSDFDNYGIYTEEESLLVIPFEYGSAMMYRASPRSWPKDVRYVRTMNNRLVSFYDVAGINRYYHCSCDKNLTCKNGGYTNPANCSECNCPVGFGGVLCDRAPAELSRTLIAEAEWKEHSFKFGFPDLFDLREFTRATLFITAPKDKTIQVQPTKMLNFYCDTYCVYNGFEVKHMGDPRMTNPLFCCDTDNDWNATFTSKLNPTPVNFFTRWNRLELEFRYRWINGSVDDLPKTSNGYDDYQYAI